MCCLSRICTNLVCDDADAVFFLGSSSILVGSSSIAGSIVAIVVVFIVVATAVVPVVRSFVSITVSTWSFAGGGRWCFGHLDLLVLWLICDTLSGGAATI